MTEKKPYDLEDRLIRFSIRMLSIADLLVKTRAGNHIAIFMKSIETANNNKGKRNNK